MASFLPWNLRAVFGCAGTTVLRRPFPAHWPDCDNWDRKTMKEFTSGWCAITVCRRCRLLGVVVPVTMVRWHLRRSQASCV
jgi:hypothetical protein